MTKIFRGLLQICFAIMFIFIWNFSAVAQTTLTGTWRTGNFNWDKLYNKKDKDSDEEIISPKKISLNFQYQNAKGKENQQGTSFEYQELQGLTQSQVESANSKVNFRIEREAGNIECEGVFQNGKGNGTFRFTANSQFVSAMKSRGFIFEKDASDNDWESENKLFFAAMMNVTTAFADDLLSANLGKLDTGDLFKARIFKIDSSFMREMKASGFPNLGMEELVKARIFKINGEYLRELNEAGFGNEPFEKVVKMRIFKITPAFITEIKNEGLTNLDIEDLVKMKIFNIDGAFIRQAKSEGVPLEVEKLVQKRIGVWRKDKDK